MYIYSLIIPHKNNPVLLQRCLDSVPERDDLQIIIIDDNSSKKYVDFTRFPGQNRPHTECYFNKVSQGAGHARNIGLSKALGKWLLFADADDYFTPSLSTILDKYKDDDETEMVFFNYNKVTDSGLEISMPITRYISNYEQGRVFSEKVLRYSAWSPWSRMIKRSIQTKHELRFEEIPFGNDMMFVLNATSSATRIRAEQELVYCYYSPSEGSQTKIKALNPNLVNLHFENRLKQRRLYEKVKYYFFSPIWYEERALKCKVSKAMRKQYGFKPFYNLKDTIAYLFAKLFHIL